jgi:hypothetical protein
MTMDELAKQTDFADPNLPNLDQREEEDAKKIEAMLPDVIAHAKKVTDESFARYKAASEDQYYPELAKLENLKERHKQHIAEKYEQLSFIGKERRRDQEERRIDDIFDSFFEWVNDSIEIKNRPYIRVIAVFQGVKA